MALSNLVYAKLLTAPGLNDEGNPTITYELPTNTANAVYEVGIFNDEGNQSYVPYRAIDKTKTSYTFNLTEDERRNLRRAAQFSQILFIRFYIRTTIGSNKYYSFLTRGFSVINANPIITAEVEDTNSKMVALTGDNKKLVKGYSNAYATMTVTPQKEAVINESFYKITNNDIIAYDTSHTFEYTEDNIFTFSAEDSRGNIGSAIIRPTMIDYIQPTCNIANNKPDALGNMTVFCYGDSFNGSFGKVSNTLDVKCRYAEYGGMYSDWITMRVTSFSDNTYYASADFVIADFDQKKSYVFEVSLADKIENLTKSTLPIKSTPLFHWGEDDFVFEVPVEFRGGVIGLSIDDLPDINNGTWKPYLLADAISSYTTRLGTYSKVGNVVTVGFYIKATCYSGYNTNTNIVIYGLPYTPLLPTAGGGMCSGAYVAAGFNFQCYVAETNGNITTRIQACNNTSATNLTTSSVSCNFREGGGEITLSGTITYYTD